VTDGHLKKREMEKGEPGGGSSSSEGRGGRHQKIGDLFLEEGIDLKIRDHQTRARTI